MRPHGRSGMQTTLALAALGLLALILSTFERLP